MIIPKAETRGIEIQERIDSLESVIKWYERNGANKSEYDIVLDEKRELERELNALGY